MPVDLAYRPDPRFAALGGEFADPVEPADFPEVRLRLRDDAAAAEVGLQGLTDKEWLSAFARFEPLPDNQKQPLATRYHGHQFRNYNPQIGDGRGFLFAQLRDGAGRLMDIGTKGSGQTPYSRDGDGRMTLQAGVREAIIARFLQAVGAPTCRILSLVETGEALTRYDEPSPTRGAVMARLQHSHVRIGTFQRLSYFEQTDLTAELMAYCIAVYFPEVEERPSADRPAAFLARVVEANAQLAARWMAAGFVHGVLNSDNMTVTGESFDYGPSRFLSTYAPDFTSAYFDHGGLYAYGRQPEATLWNLVHLAGCLAPLADIDTLRVELERFHSIYERALGEAMAARLGVVSRGERHDGALAHAAFECLIACPIPFEALFFDWFGGEAASAERALDGPRARHYQGEAFSAFRGALEGYEPARSLPSFFGRDHPVLATLDRVRAAWGAIEDTDDWGVLEALLADIGEMQAGYDLAASAYKTPTR